MSARVIVLVLVSSLFASRTPAKGARELGKLSYSGPGLSHIARQYCLQNDPS